MTDTEQAVIAVSDDDPLYGSKVTNIVVGPTPEQAVIAAAERLRDALDGFSRHGLRKNGKASADNYLAAEDALCAAVDALRASRCARAKSLLDGARAAAGEADEPRACQESLLYSDHVTDTGRFLCPRCDASQPALEQGWRYLCSHCGEEMARIGNDLRLYGTWQCPERCVVNIDITGITTREDAERLERKHVDTVPPLCATPSERHATRQAITDAETKVALESSARRADIRRDLDALHARRLRQPIAKPLKGPRYHKWPGDSE